MNVLRLLLYVATAVAWTVEKTEATVATPGDAVERESFASIRDSGGLDLAPGRTLDVAFKVPEAPPKPHQAMLRIFAPDLADERLFQAKIRGKNAKVNVPHRSVPWEFREIPLEVSVIVASFEGGEPVETEPFELFVQHDEHSKAAKMHNPRAINFMGPNPEILHEFRPQPSHVNALIALVFVAAIFALFGLAVYSWKTSGLLPQSLTVKVGVFVATVVAVEAVFLGYYVNWSIFSALTAFSVLGPVLLWAGKRL